MDDKLVNKAKDILQAALDKEAAKEGLRYAIKIMVKGEFYGYHLSTLCQVTNDLYKAKRYMSGHEEEQIQIISDNIKHTVENGKIGDDSIFGDTIYKKYWKGVEFKDIFLDTEYLPKDLEPMKRTVTVF